MSAENPKYWGFEGDERLTCNTIEERLEELAEKSEVPLDETVELIGYDQMEVEQERFADWILENLLESLDNEYAFEDETMPTESMKQAAAEFVAKVAAEYEVHMCKIVCTKTVNTADYITPEVPDVED